MSLENNVNRFFRTLKRGVVSLAIIGAVACGGSDGNPISPTSPTSPTNPTSQNASIDEGLLLGKFGGTKINANLVIGGAGVLVNDGRYRISPELGLRYGKHIAEITGNDGSFILRSTPITLTPYGILTNMEDPRITDVKGLMDSQGQIPLDKLKSHDASLGTGHTVLDVYDVDQNTYDLYRRTAMNSFGQGESRRVTKPVTFLIYDKTIFRRGSTTYEVDNTNGMKPVTLSNAIAAANTIKELLDSYFPGSTVVLESQVGNAPNPSGSTRPDNYSCIFSVTNPINAISAGYGSDNHRIKNSILEMNHNGDVGLHGILTDLFENLGFNNERDVPVDYVERLGQVDRLTDMSIKLLNMKMNRMTGQRSDPRFPDFQQLTSQSQGTRGFKGFNFSFRPYGN